MNRSKKHPSPKAIVRQIEKKLRRKIDRIIREILGGGR
jgi:hypothetical protein